MKNAEKYKGAEERAEAFNRFCKMDCSECRCLSLCGKFRLTGAYAWLDMEAEDEQPLPCPFCGKVMAQFYSTSTTGRFSCVCGYHTPTGDFAMIADAHNRVARAVAKAKEEVIAWHNRLAKAAMEFYKEEGK